MSKPLNLGERHILKLIVRDADEHGWVAVSRVVYPIIEKMPAVLVEHESLEDGGRVRLTEEGRAVVYAMPWLEPPR